MSYRLDATANNDRWIGFREWYRHGWKKSKLKSPLSIESNLGEGHLLMTWNHLKDRAALTYVQDHSSQNVSHFLGKDCIEIQHSQTSFFNRLLWHVGALLISLRCFCIKSQRPNWSLIIRESIELAFIAEYCQEENIRLISFFHPYEIDSNVIAHFLMSKGVVVQFIPSIIPLYVHNHHLICDQLVITTPYQLDEIKHQFSSSIFYKHLVYWSAESIGRNIQKNKNWSSQCHNPKTIAFYSHGQWLRNELQRADNGLNLEQTENELLLVLNLVVQKFDLALTIFLHPLEKKNLARAEQHYHERLNIPFQWANIEERSAQSFHAFHWGIGAMSSVVFERLLMGHKTILFQHPGFIFPIKNSGIQNICLFQEADISACLEAYEKTTAEQFFKEKNIASYYHFPDFR